MGNLFMVSLIVEQKYLKESSNGKRAVADTAEARMAYTQLEDVLEAELGASFQKDGYCGGDPDPEMESEVLEKQERLEEAWRQMEQALAVIKEEIGELQGGTFHSDWV